MRHLKRAHHKQEEYVSV